MFNCSGNPTNATTSSSGGSISNGGAGALGGSMGTSGASNAGDSVLQRQNDAKRDGLYIQPTLTKVKAAAMRRDTTLNATIQGNVYAQPLYVQNGPSGKGIFIVVTESNNVHAVSETDGSSVWTKISARLREPRVLAAVTSRRSALPARRLSICRRERCS